MLGRGSLPPCPSSPSIVHSTHERLTRRLDSPFYNTLRRKRQKPRKGLASPMPRSCLAYTVVARPIEGSQRGSDARRWRSRLLATRVLPLFNCVFSSGLALTQF